MMEWGEHRAGTLLTALGQAVSTVPKPPPQGDQALSKFRIAFQNHLFRSSWGFPGRGYRKPLGEACYSLHLSWHCPMCPERRQRRRRRPSWTSRCRGGWVAERAAPAALRAASPGVSATTTIRI